MYHNTLFSILPYDRDVREVYCKYFPNKKSAPNSLIRQSRDMVGYIHSIVEKFKNMSKGVFPDIVVLAPGTYDIIRLHDQVM